MLIKENMLYQVKLIIDCLPDDEYMRISQDTINYIEDNYEYNENIKIDANIPLEKQNLDRGTIRFLEKIILEIDDNKKNENDKLFEDVLNKDFDFKDIKIENVKLKELVDVFKKENLKIPKIKDLVNEYKIQLNQANKKIEILENRNEYLTKVLNKIPKFIRNIFIRKQDVKLLN